MTFWPHGFQTSTSFAAEKRLRTGTPLAAATWVARLVPAGAFFLTDGPKALLDAEGHFTLEATGEGEFQLVLSARADAT